MDDLKDLLELWVLKGIISPEQAAKMLADLDVQGGGTSSDKAEPVVSEVGVEVADVYEPEFISDVLPEVADAIPEKKISVGQRSASVIRFFLIFGAILLGVGTILFVASHWGGFHRLIKIAIAATCTLTALSAGFLLRSERFSRPRTSDAVFFVTTLLFGATIHLIAQLYNMGLPQQWFMLFWALAIIPLVYTVASTAMALTVSVLWFIAHSLFVKSAVGSWFGFIFGGSFSFSLFEYGLCFIILGAFFFLISVVHSYYPRLEKLARVYRRVGLWVGIPALFTVVRLREHDWVYSVPDVKYGHPVFLFLGFMVGIGLLCFVWIGLKRLKESFQNLVLGSLTLAAMLLAFVALLYPAYSLHYVFLFNLIWIALSVFIIVRGLRSESYGSIALGILAFVSVVLGRLGGLNSLPPMLVLGVLCFSLGAFNSVSSRLQKVAQLVRWWGIYLATIVVFLLSFEWIVVGNIHHVYSFLFPEDFIGAFYAVFLLAAAALGILAPFFITRLSAKKSVVDSSIAALLLGCAAVLFFYHPLNQHLFVMFFNTMVALICLVIMSDGVRLSNVWRMSGGFVGLILLAVSHIDVYSSPTQWWALVLALGIFFFMSGQWISCNAVFAPLAHYYRLGGAGTILVGLYLLSFESLVQQVDISSLSFITIFYFGFVAVLALGGALWSLCVKKCRALKSGILTAILSVLGILFSASVFFNLLSGVVLANLICAVVAGILVWQGLKNQSHGLLAGGFSLVAVLAFGRIVEKDALQALGAFLCFALVLSVGLVLLGRWISLRPGIAESLRNYRIIGLAVGLCTLYLWTFRGVALDLYDSKMFWVEPMHPSFWSLGLVFAFYLGFVIFLVAPLLVAKFREIKYSWESLFETLIALVATVVATVFFMRPLMGATAGISTLMLLWNVVFANLLIFAAAILLMVTGVHREAMERINLGMFLLVLVAVSRYFDILWNLVSKSLFFMLGGLLLLVCGSILEWQRRALKEAFARSDQNVALK